MTTNERQPMLFADLPLPSAPPEAPPATSRRTSGPPRRPRKRHQQLALDFDFREFGRSAAPAIDEDDDAFDYPQHRRTVHGRDPAPVTRAAASVWDLAASVRNDGRRTARFAQAGRDSDSPLYRVEREAGRVKVVRLRPEETEEWAERERVRRAKQRPPRPPKGAKTRGKKVREWDGEAVED